MEDLWAATQDPQRDQRWDARFGAITYEPREEGAPQRFAYATTVAPGVTVAGTGESLGERDRADGSRRTSVSGGTSASSASASRCTWPTGCSAPCSATGARGSFTVVERACGPDDIPLDMRPLREELRE